MSKIKTLPAAMPLNGLGFGEYITRSAEKVPVEFEIADLLVPGAWAHHATKFKKGHEIVAYRADLAWRVQLLVTEVGVGFLKVHLLSKWENPDHKPAVAADVDDEPLPDLPANYKVRYAPNAGYQVLTIEPQAKVATKPTKRAAYDAAIAHARVAEGLAA